MAMQSSGTITLNQAASYFGVAHDLYAFHGVTYYTAGITIGGHGPFTFPAGQLDLEIFYGTMTPAEWTSGGGTTGGGK